MEEEEARDLVRQQPGLLTHQWEVLKARLHALARLLGAPHVGPAALMARREPGLLALRHEAVAARWVFRRRTRVGWHVRGSVRVGMGCWHSPAPPHGGARVRGNHQSHNLSLHR